MQPENKISVEDKIIATLATINERNVEIAKSQLEILINDLINNNFDILVQILYRIDVDERMIKKLLQENNGADAASIIAGLIIKRQLQKIASKKLYKKNSNPDSEEKW